MQHEATMEVGVVVEAQTAVILQHLVPTEVVMGAKRTNQEVMRTAQADLVEIVERVDPEEVVEHVPSPKLLVLPPLKSLMLPQLIRLPLRTQIIGPASARGVHMEEEQVDMDL